MKIQLFEIDACFTKVRVLTENNLICVSATLPDLNWDHFQQINYQRLSLDCLAFLTTPQGQFKSVDTSGHYFLISAF